MQTTKFSSLNLSKEILKAVQDAGFEISTPIQTKSIPPLLEGKDVIGQAMTGTGKTAAFAIPAIEKTDASKKKVQTLIICPTRELALQVAKETNKFLKYKEEIHEIPIYGGQSIDHQIRGLRRGPQIVIGTPGRLLDHIGRRTLNLKDITTVILDEADEMLKMGFAEDIEKILKTTPTERQTVLFSATMPREILKLANKYQNNPELIKIVHENVTIPEIEQKYFEANGRNKLDILLHLFESEKPKKSIIFCNTKRMVDKLVTNLNAHGYYTEALHGDMTQNKRNRVMDKFRKNKIDTLIATDVAARGIDVKDIEIVFNYDIPTDEEFYVHRIGRTGRAGKTGKAYTFIFEREIHLLRTIEKYIKSRITRGILPTSEQILESQADKISNKIREVIKQKNLEKYISSIEQSLIKDNSLIDIAAALLKMHLEKSKSDNKVDGKDSNKYRNKRSSRDRNRSGNRDRSKNGRRSYKQK
ncbi:DEAD/DEAH box helicase [Candidatus Babeliales bacterium]|nr:DEAD/DEAH box helicase [Candidatus Babeliales bacterium]